MKRRLTIAAGLVHSPQILFLDEPTVGLDVASARVIRQLITTLKEQGVTIVLTSHYIEEVDQLCDRVAILDKGQITTIDSPAAFAAIARVSAYVFWKLVVTVSFTKRAGPAATAGGVDSKAPKSGQAA